MNDLAYVTMCLLGVVIFAGALVTCEGEVKEAMPVERTLEYKLHVIEGCEYVYYRTGGYGWLLVHHGGCKNHER